MPYAFSPLGMKPESGYVRTMDLPLNEWMGVKFGQFEHDTIWNAVSRRIEDYIYDDENTIAPEKLNKDWGVPGHLTFDRPMSLDRAMAMRKRKEDELRRLAYLDSATHSWASGRAAIGTLSGMVGAVSNPLDFSLLFVPFVGSSAKAAGVAKMGGSLARQRFARGFIPAEELFAGSRFPLFGAAVVNAGLGSAVTEIPVFMQNMRDQAQYGIADAALNVGLGGVFGGAFHAAGAGIGKVFRKAAEAHAGLNPDAQEAALRQAINDMGDDSPITADRHATTDMATIRADIQFDEAAARARAMEAMGILPEEAQARAILETVNVRRASATDLLDLARQRAERGGASGQIAQRLVDRFVGGERTVGLMNQIAEFFELRYDPDAPTLQERLKTNMFSGMDTPGAVAAFKQTRRELFQTEQVLQRSLDDLANTTDPLIQQRLRSNIDALQQQRNRLTHEVDQVKARLAASQPLTPDEIAAHSEEMRGKLDDSEAIAKAAELETRAEAIKTKRIGEALEQERARWQSEVDGTARQKFVAELTKEIEAGKMLTEKQVKDLRVDPLDESGMKLINEQIASLEANLKAKGEASPIDDVIAKDIETMDRELAKLATDKGKAYDEAANCLAKTMV